MENGYPTAAAAALADWDWDPTASARVLAVTVDGDAAVVLLETEPMHRMRVRCEQRDGRWFVVPELGPPPGA